VNINGGIVFSAAAIDKKMFVCKAENLAEGIYFYKVETSRGKANKGKLIKY
jgi:hypothetical protein